MYYFMNIENGNVFEKFSEMFKEAKELYDVDDETNSLDWTEYYKVIFVEM